MSSSSSSFTTSYTPKKIKGPVFYSTLPKAHSKDKQIAKVHVKLPSLLTFHADQTSRKIISRKQTGRKVLKHVSKMKIDKACKIPPINLRNMTSNCKHYNLQSNSHNKVPTSLKMINKVVSKHLCSLDLSGVIQVSVRRTDIKTLLNLISSRRNLQNLKLDVNFSLHMVPTDLIRRTFSTLNKLNSLMINIPSLSKGNSAEESTSSLETIISSIKNLKSLYLKCCVTRHTCEELLSTLETITNLEKLGVFIETPERLSPGFFSQVAESLSKVKKLRGLEVSLDSYINQRLSNAFFLPFSKLRTLENLTVIINKLSVNDNDMQALFKTLPNLYKLKKFHFESNTRSLTLSNEYIMNFREALVQMTQLESFTYYVNQLHSRHFSDIFKELPRFPHLKSLALNLTISEGELANVYFLNEFLKNAKQLKSLSLRINDEDLNAYTYQVPSEVFTILGEGFEKVQSLENFELSLGTIEDEGLDKILSIVDKLTKLSCLKLNASFDDIDFKAFGSFCNYLQRNKRRFNHLQVLPKGYSLPNVALLTKVTKEINAGAV